MITERLKLMPVARWIAVYRDNSILRRLNAGARWSLFGEAGSRALTFVATAIVARVLGVDEFGGFSLIQGCLAMFMTFAAFGIGQTTGRYVAALKNTQPGRISGLNSLAVSFSALSGAVAAAVLWLASPLITTEILRAPQLSVPLQMAAPALFFSSIAGALNGTLAGFESFERLAKQGWTIGLASFLFVVLGVLVAGVLGAAIGLALAEIARTAMAAWSVSSVLKSHGMPFFAGTGLNESKILWSFSLPTVIAGALHVPVFWICQAIIAAGPNGLFQVGIYNAAQKWMTLVIFVPTAASAIVGPVLASLTGSPAYHRATTLWIAAAQVAACAIPAVLVALLAPVAMSVFGVEFTSGSSTLIVMMTLAPISMAVRLAWGSLLSLERAWTSCLLWLLWSALALGLTWTWRDGGAYGLTWAMLVAYAAALIAYGGVLSRVWRT